MPKRIMIIAGEASGDLHGGELVKALKAQTPDLEIFGVGGNNMKNAGMELYYHVDQLAYIGFWEVIKHYPFFRRIFNDLLKKYNDLKPDIVVLIDYPGFNLRFAKKIHSLGGKVFYYIAPQVWAWHQSRAKKMAKFIDQLAVIFGFEKTFFDKYGLKTTFVGHPLVEGLKIRMERDEFLTGHSLNNDNPILGLFPGSRNQEVESLLPAMLSTAFEIQKEHPELQIAVSKAETITLERIQAHIPENANIHIVSSQVYELMKYADAAIVASGTATLETACFETPFAIAYRVSPLSFAIGKRVVKIKHIGLANIVAGKEVAREFIQDDLNSDNLKPEVEKLLFDNDYRDQRIQQLKTVRGKLGNPGAAARTASLIQDMIK